LPFVPNTILSDGIRALSNGYGSGPRSPSGIQSIGTVTRRGTTRTTAQNGPDIDGSLNFLESEANEREFLDKLEHRFTSIWKV
jgi:hypothetical protein